MMRHRVFVIRLCKSGTDRVTDFVVVAPRIVHIRIRGIPAAQEGIARIQPHRGGLTHRARAGRIIINDDGRADAAVIVDPLGVAAGKAHTAH